MDLPERFRRIRDEEEEDVDDGTGLKSIDKTTGMFAAQSMYGLLAATQSKPNFQGQFQQDSGSDSEGETEDERAGKSDPPQPKSAELVPAKSKASTKGHKKRLSDNKLVRSFLKPIRERGDSQGQDAMTQSQFLPPREKEPIPEEKPASVRSDAPILDRKLQAMARAEMESSTSSVSGRKSREGRTSSDLEQAMTSRSLPHVIASIFHFAEPEEVVSEYPCWYLQNVLLQGFMYITQKHVCFYAYLQKKSAATVKSGHLGKLGKHSYRYRRYWFVLKGDTFSYYRDSSEPYFPLGVVDLRYAISADLNQDKAKNPGDFTVTTAARVYQYRADTALAAKEWVKQLQKIIFRSHNEGDSVKISLPIENILDVERTEVVDFAETIKLRVIDNEETFAIDEYFFTFFQFGKDALNVLSILTDNNAAKKAAEVVGGATSPLSKVNSPAQRQKHRKIGSMEQSQQLTEPVRATLAPLSAADRSSPRASGEQRRSSFDFTRRGSTDRGRASIDGLRRSFSAQSRNSFQGRSTSKSPLSPSIQESTESFVTSSEQPDSSTNEDEMDANMSASQMLTDDHVFRGPTLRMPQPRRTESGFTVERLRQGLQQSSRSSSQEAEPALRVHPPTRTRTEASRARERPELHRADSSGSRRTVEGTDVDTRTEGTVPRLIRGISTPLQHAMNVAGMVNQSSKRMGSYLSNSPKTYLSNWGEAIAGGKRHYTDEGLAPDDSIKDPEQEVDVAEHERRFQDHFGLPTSEKLIAVFYCWLHKTVPLYGKVYMGTRRFCFRSLWYGTKTKLVIPYKDILNVQKQRGFRWGYPGMVLVIRGYEELFFDFPNNGLRDDCVVTTLKHLEAMDAAAESVLLTEGELQEAEDAAAENSLLRDVRKNTYANDVIDLPGEVPAVLFDDAASVLEFKPKQPMRITCLTIGSRGDVQPYIALCKGLIADGHKAKIATHKEFQGWVEKHGIEFAEVAGDPAELMRICVDNGMFTPSFFIEANSVFRSWIDELLKTAWIACQDAELIIESPSAMGGIHIAERLEVPYFRAFTMPWTRTRAYPHAFAVPNKKMGGAYNYMTYTFFDNMFWTAISGQVNKFRTQTMGIRPTSLDRMQQNKVPFLYNFSPSVVVPPLDFSDWIKVTGYWFLDEGTDWTPPEELAMFIKKARDDKQKLVYIGFGSVTVADSRQLMQQVVDAVVKADVRCILSRGWSDRLDKNAAAQPEPDLPPCIHKISSAPHDWLFKQVDAVVHHGGAGTTGASLRAGVPTIIKPFFGDQFFFATRVEDLGVGIHLKKVTANQLGKALWVACNDERMRSKSRALGEDIRSQHGVQAAINAIYRDLDYARTLIKKPQRITKASSDATPGIDGSEEGDNNAVDVSEDTEENWTFVENEGDFAAAETAAFGTLAMEMGGGGPAGLSLSKSRSGGSGHGRQMSLGSMVLRGRS